MGDLAATIGGETEARAVKSAVLYDSRHER